MELDSSTHAKEDELLFIFRSLTPEQQAVMLAMARGVFGERPTVDAGEVDSSRVVH